MTKEIRMTNVERPGPQLAVEEYGGCRINLAATAGRRYSCFEFRREDFDMRALDFVASHDDFACLRTSSVFAPASARLRHWEVEAAESYWSLAMTGC